MTNNAPKPTKTSIVIGMMLILAGLVTVVVIRDLGPQAFWIVRVIVALGVGFVAAGLLGNLVIEGRIANITVKAGGPMALTVLVYLLNPPELMQRLF